MPMTNRKRERARDSRGRPVPGLYVRDGRFLAGFKLDGRWTMRTLTAETLTEARRERASLIAGLREGRIARPSGVTFADCLADWQASRVLSERTLRDEQAVARRYLAHLLGRRVQDVTAAEVAAVLRRHRHLADWTRLKMFRVMAGTFSHAVRRGMLTRSPIDGLAKAERPRQRNARHVARLTIPDIECLIAAASTARARAALGLAGLAGLRVGEIRALDWGEVDFEAGTVTVLRACASDGSFQPPKSEAGIRTVPMLPALRALLVPLARFEGLVIGTRDGKPVEERNLRRWLEQAKIRAGMDEGEARLSFHSLRHSFGSYLATDLQLPPTTVARLMGHADAGFTLRAYARDARDDAAVVADVLARAARAKS
jgi:integrase